MRRNSSQSVGRSYNPDVDFRVSGKLSARINNSLLTMFLVLSPQCLWGADTAVVIEARAGNHKVSSENRQSESGQRAKPTLTTKAGEPLTITWTATRSATSGPLANSTLHVFVDRENAVGSADAPKPGKEALYESAVLLDLEPGSQTSGEVHLAAPGSGAYLLRGEISGGQPPGPAIFAALRIVIP